MVVESGADRALFLADFGVDAVCSRGGASATVRGILDNPTRVEEGETGAGSLMAHPSFLCAQADLPAGFSAGDSVSVEGRPYVAKPPQPDGAGMVLILLERV